MVLANYPNKDSRIANGVGLDSPASVVGMMEVLAAQGYQIDDAPKSSEDLMERILAGPTNADGSARRKSRFFALHRGL